MIFAFQGHWPVPFVRQASPRCCRNTRRRRSDALVVSRPVMCAEPSTTEFGQQADILYDDLISDDTHVVINGDEIAHLIEELRRTGRDTMAPLDDGSDSNAFLDEQFLDAAEKHVDGDGSIAVRKDNDEKTEKADRKEEHKPETLAEPTKYFQESNVQYMPSWLKELYRTDQVTELEEGADRLFDDVGKRRLHDILGREQPVKGSKSTVAGDGIIDCTVSDVADDYHVPVEFVVDAMISYGVPIPISRTTSIRNSMTTDEIEKLLKLLTTFDAADLADRYSDRTVSELAYDYDVHEASILEICHKEGLYVYAQEKTRLSVVREDRVMDILLNGEPLGTPYPALLDGLE